MASGRLSSPVGMGLAGLAFGAAMLAKFAAIYALIGLTLIYLHGHMTREKLFGGRDISIALLAFGLAASPNIIWNFANEFSTVRHLSYNANLSQQSSSMAGVWQFIGGQFAVAGPVVLLFMIIAAITHRYDHKSYWLIWMSAPCWP